MALHDIVVNDDVCVRMERGDIGSLTEISAPDYYIAKIIRVSPAENQVIYGVDYGVDGNEFTGNVIVGGTASLYATLAKESGANARTGSGVCAKFTPTSTIEYGYWHFYVPATEDVPFYVSFFHKSSSGWDGLLKVSIFDTDQTTFLLESENVTLVDDSAYHLHNCAECTPTTTGMALVRVEIKDGDTTGYIFIDDLNIA